MPSSSLPGLKKPAPQSSRPGRGECAFHAFHAICLTADSLMVALDPRNGWLFFCHYGAAGRLFGGALGPVNPFGPVEGNAAPLPTAPGGANTFDCAAAGGLAPTGWVDGNGMGVRWMVGRPVGAGGVAALAAASVGSFNTMRPCAPSATMASRRLTSCTTKPGAISVPTASGRGGWPSTDTSTAPRPPWLVAITPDSTKRLDAAGAGVGPATDGGWAPSSRASAAWRVDASRVGAMGCTVGDSGGA
jgi:hypothetical protein